MELDFDSPMGQQFLDRIHFDGVEDPPEPEPDKDDGDEDRQEELELQRESERIPAATRPNVPRADFFNEQSREYVEQLVKVINLSRV